VARVAFQVGLFVVYTALSVAGVVILRAFLPALVGAYRSGGAWLPHVWLPTAGAAMYAVSFGCWLAILATTPASRAYPIAVGLTLVGVTLSAVLFLGERVGPMQLAGLVAVFAGIVMISQSSS